jgi:hypothetical protein
VLDMSNYDELARALDDYAALEHALVPIDTLKERLAGWGHVERKRRQRKPSIASLIQRAEKTGKTVRAITTAEGVTLTFGTPGADDAKPNGNGAYETPEDLRKLI